MVSNRRTHPQEGEHCWPHALEVGAADFVALSLMMHVDDLFNRNLMFADGFCHSFGDLSENSCIN